MVRDNPQLQDDGGEIYKSQGRGWLLNPFFWNILFTLQNTCWVVNCNRFFVVGMSAFYLKKQKNK